jgi:hypothetical protein
VRRVLLVVLLVLVLPVGPALAGNKGKGGHEARRTGMDGEQFAAAGVQVDVDVVFTSHEREVYRDWSRKRHGPGHCPPGLAKKNNGCLPPGQAKKRYGVGHPCDRDLLGPVPADLMVVLGPAPKGYVYATLDGDLLKLAVGTFLVVDAIDGLVD